MASSRDRATTTSWAPFVVPGSPMDPRHEGSNILIRDGAILTRGANDILSVLGLPQSPPQAVEFRICTNVFGALVLVKRAI